MKKPIKSNEILTVNIEQTLKLIGDTYMTVQQSLNRINEQTNLVMQGMANNIGQMILGMQNAMGNIFNEEFFNRMQEFAREMEQLPDNMRLVILKLAEQGWFYGIDTTPAMFKEMKLLLKNGDIETIEGFLIQYFNEQLDDIEKMIIKNFPDRELIIKEAFEAHRDGKYTLSVPVLLAQAEGMCYEITKQNCFGKNKGIPHMVKYIKEKGLDDDEIASAMAAPLMEVLPINQNVKNKVDSFKGLNRHIVLHGKSTDYGTEKNSLKAISYVDYIVQFFNAIGD